MKHLRNNKHEIQTSLLTTTHYILYIIKSMGLYNYSKAKKTVYSKVKTDNSSHYICNFTVMTKAY